MLKKYTCFSFCLCLLLSFCVRSNGQALSGTYTIATSGGSYTSLALAISDLNAKGLSGNVTFNVPAGWTETAPAGGYSLTKTGTSSNHITIQKSGSGANPLLTAPTGGTATVNTSLAQLDGVFRLIGVSYVTINGIDLQENSSNTTPAAQMEFGYGMFKVNGTTGCQHNIIENCNITLNKANFSTVAGPAVANGCMGILMANTTNAAPATNVTVTAATGENSYNVLINNNITNVFEGIYVRGYSAASPYTLYDQGNIIGRPGQGNIITNFGTGTSALTTYGIFLYSQNADSIAGDSINNTANGGSGHTNAITGIYQYNSTNSTVYAVSNKVYITQGGNAGAFMCININVAGTGTVNINNNTLFSSTSAAATGLCYIIYNQGLAKNSTIKNNILQSSTVNTTTNAYFINTTGGTNGSTCTNNRILGLNKSAAGGTVYGYYNVNNTTTVNTESILYNSFSNITVTGATVVYGINSGTNNENKNVNYDTISNITGSTSNVTGISVDKTDTLTNITGNYLSTITAGGTVIGITCLSAGTNEFTQNIRSNYLTGIGSTGASGSTYGIYLLNTTVSTVNITKNTLTAFSATGATSPTTYGIRNTTGPVYVIDSNTLSNFTIPNAATTTTNYGIYSLGSGSSKTSKVFQNTISDFSGKGTTNNNYGIYAQAATASGTTNIYNNTISGLSGLATTNNNRGINIAAGLGSTTTNVYSNTVKSFTCAGTTGNNYGIVFTAGASGSTTSIYKNNINTISGTSTTTTCYGINATGGASGSFPSSIDSNNISGISGNKIFGIYTVSATAGGSTTNIFNDTIVNLTGTTNVYGINQGASTVTNTQIYQNSIYNLSSSLNTGLVFGLFIQSGSVTSIINNLISDLRDPVSNGSNSIVGIYAFAGTTFNVYYNTIYLNASSSGTAFGSSAVTFTNTISLDLRNNILANNSTYTGIGITAALLATTPTALGTPPATSNYAKTSNNNAFYVPTGVGNYYAYADKATAPTNAYTSGCSSSGFVGYRIFIGSGRDSTSFFELPPFVNISSTPYNLHMMTTTGTATESGGLSVGGITTDADGNLRQGSLGYTGNGSAPDVGAEEFNGKQTTQAVTWSGTVSTDWNNNKNWCPYAPTSTNNVTIPSGTPFFPTVTSNGYAKNLTINNGASVTIGTGAQLNVYDTLSNSGTYSNTAGTLAMVKAHGTQIMSPLTNYNLIIDDTDNVNVTRPGVATVTNLLTLTSGHFNCDTVYITNVSPSAITGYLSPDSANYSTSPWIIGCLKRQILSSGTYDYPIGSTSQPQFVTFNLNGIVGTSFLTLKVSSSNLGCTVPNPDSASVSGTPIQTLLDGAYWLAGVDAEPVSGTYDIALNERSYTTYPGNAAQMTVLRRSACASAWKCPGASVNSTQRFVNGTAHAERTSLTAFSNFAIGFGDAPLPVKLLNFDAHASSAKIVHTNWTTATQENNHLFNVQRSSDGVNFNTIGTLPGCGSCSRVTDYSFDDKAPLSGSSFYRLQMVDDRNNMSYSLVRIVDISGVAPQIKTTPNPSQGAFTLDVTQIGGAQTADVQIMNIFGQVVNEQTVDISNGVLHIAYNLNGYSEGIYFIKVIIGGHVSTGKIVYQK